MISSWLNQKWPKKIKIILTAVVHDCTGCGTNNINFTEPVFDNSLTLDKMQV